jgi:hypothetical protein
MRREDPWQLMGADWIEYVRVMVRHVISLARLRKYSLSR